MSDKLQLVDDFENRVVGHQFEEIRIVTPKALTRFLRRDFKLTQYRKSIAKVSDKLKFVGHLLDKHENRGSKCRILDSQTHSLSLHCST